VTVNCEEVYSSKDFMKRIIMILTIMSSLLMSPFGVDHAMNLRMETIVWPILIHNF